MCIQINSIIYISLLVTLYNVEGGVPLKSVFHSQDSFIRAC